ncbi:MAG: TetR/AcrR family transcriptional regulator [Myxococcota bacterium]
MTDERSQRIIDTAVELAEKDGFTNVRLRDVAAHAKVALGTVYKRFRSKEEILVAALAQEAKRLQDAIEKRPLTGTTAEERVLHFFSTATRGLLKRPKLARALVRSIATGGPLIHDKVATFHAMTTMLLVAALRDQPVDGPLDWGGDADKEWREIAELLQHIWFAALVGWASGVFEDRMIMEKLKLATRRMVRPLESAE